MGIVRRGVVIVSAWVGLAGCRDSLDLSRAEVCSVAGAVVHVDAASGSDANDGSAQDPLATLDEAIKRLALGSARTVLVAADDVGLAASASLPAGVRLLGGRDPSADWSQGVLRTRVTGPAPVFLVEAPGTCLAGMEIVPSSGASASVGVRVVGVDVRLVDTIVAGGSGADGAPGAIGAPGTTPATAAPGNPFSGNAGGTGGAGAVGLLCPDGSLQGSGGAGGAGGSDGMGAAAKIGSAGAAAPGGGGAGGPGGDDQDGQDGSNPTPVALAGSAGTPAVLAGAFDSQGSWLPLSGGDGTAGAPGLGGGGGGGGGAEGNGGGGGAGGGAGSCGGIGGTGGTGGSASVGLLVIDGTVELQGTSVVAGRGGSGGPGGLGALAALPGAGGTGANGANNGGDGGDGASGGPGGKGGGGAGAPAVAVWLQDGATLSLLADEDGVDRNALVVGTAGTGAEGAANGVTEAILDVP